MPVSSILAGVVVAATLRNPVSVHDTIGVQPEVDEGGAVVGRGAVQWVVRVAMRRASERSVLSEKFQRVGSWDAITMSSTKSRSMRARVCSHDGPVQTVSGSTRARRPSPGRSLGAAVATKAAPSPAVADACLDFQTAGQLILEFSPLSLRVSPQTAGYQLRIG